jgi:hypothetical protein
MLLEVRSGMKRYNATVIADSYNGNKDLQNVSGLDCISYWIHTSQ